MYVNDSTRSAIEAFLALVEGEGNRLVDADAVVRETGDVPLGHFLCGLAEHREIAFHGTGDPGITSFEPREPIDYAPFGRQRAVFATSDPIWAMFYAVVDRDRFALTLNNGCIYVTGPDGSVVPPHYYSTITSSALPEQPWRTGYVYLPPTETFVAPPP
jgi:hypothetical protein